MTTTRQNKVRELLKQEVSDIIRREIKDPRLGFLTITDAEITADLKHAKVYVTVLGDEQERKQSMDVLKHAQHFIRQEFGKRVRMKILPDVQFFYDESVDRGVRIFELLEEIKRDDQEQS
ncbi:MAG: 30S ribosome-binding factor RbfA [Armatimonadota bacterium]|jgi:ribosome-binding factor A